MIAREPRVARCSVAPLTPLPPHPRPSQTYDKRSKRFIWVNNWNGIRLEGPPLLLRSFDEDASREWEQAHGPAGAGSGSFVKRRRRSTLMTVATALAVRRPLARQIFRHAGV